MFTAKDLRIRIIDSKSARKVCERFHYSKKAVNNSQIHFGVFLKENLEGVLSFGPSIDKRRVGKSIGVGMNEFIELNRMALSDRLPKNSESRSISYCLKALRKQYPFLKCVVSFADGCQCGDGTIYRASGFILNQISKNTSMLTDGKRVVANKSLDRIVSSDGRTARQVIPNLRPIEGYMLRYVYVFDKALKIKLIPFDQIPENVKMYKGVKRAELESKALGPQPREGGAIPTSALHFKKVADG